MIVKVISLLVAASFAAIKVSQMNTKSTWKQTELQDAVESEKAGKNDEEIANSDDPDEEKENWLMSSKRVNNVREENMLEREIEQRRVSFQGKLLELYGLKEEKQYLTELQTLAEEKSTVIGILKVNLASLKADKQTLEEEARRGALAVKNLEAAKRVIAEMERKVGVNAWRIKGRISMIEGRVRNFRADETLQRDDRIEEKLKSLGRLELEVGKTKRRGRELELEKRELTVKLAAAEDTIASLSQITEAKIMETIEHEISTLRHGNEALSREVEKLQRERFKFVEELVYQRWLNGCLRFEAQNKDYPQTQTLKDDNASRNSDQKTRGFSHSFSSLSSSTESDPVDVTSTFGSSSKESSQNSSAKSFNFIRRITRWRSRIDQVLTQKSKPRRFSTSEVEKSSLSMRTNEAAIKAKPRVRRVSFSDHLVKKLGDEDELKTNPEMIRFKDNVFQSGDDKSSNVDSEIKPRIDMIFTQNIKARRFSMSEVEKSSSSMRSNEAAMKSEDQFGSAKSLRVRRVSFGDDLVKKLGNDGDELIKIPNIRSGDQVLRRGFEKSKSNDDTEVEENIHGVGTLSLKNENVDDSEENKVKDHMQHLFAMLGFLLFIFIAYVLHSSTRFLR